MADKIFNDRQLKLIQTKLDNFIVKPFGVPETAWQKLAPVKNVKSRSGVFYVMKDTGLFELADRISPAEWAKYNTENWSSSSYEVADYGRGFFATKDELQEADSELNLLQNRMRLALTNLELRKEYEFFKLVNNSSSYGVVATATSAWVNSATGEPDNTVNIIVELNKYKDQFAEQTNYTVMPNTIIMTKKFANLLAGHDKLYDVKKYTEKEIYRETGIPKVIAGLNVVTVSSKYISTVQRRKSSPAKTSMLDNNKIILAYINKVPDNTWIVCFQRHPRRTLINENNAKVFSGDVEETYGFKVIQPKYAMLVTGVYA